jgi:hypothetical protein
MCNIYEVWKVSGTHLLPLNTKDRRRANTIEIDKKDIRTFI